MSVFALHLTKFHSVQTPSEYIQLAYYVIESLQRDAMHKRGTSRRPVSVCTSVCPSVGHTCVLYSNG